MTSDQRKSHHDRKLADKAMDTVRYLRKNLRDAQIALCPHFEKCAEDEGAACLCFPGEGPYANSIPRNLKAERLLVAAKAFDADLSEYCDGPPRDALRAAIADAEAPALTRAQDEGRK